MKIIKSRTEKENHVTVKAEGPNAEEIGKVIRMALRKMECRKETDYHITMTDSHQ